MIVAAIIAGLFTLGVVLLIVCARRRRPWSPFDKNGYVDYDRLRAEGWHWIGAMREDINESD